MCHGRRGAVAVGVSAACETERAHPTHNPSDISIGSTVFAEMAAKCPYTFGMGRPFPASELPLPMGIWTPSNTWLPGPTRVVNPNGILIGLAVLQGSLV